MTTDYRALCAELIQTWDGTSDFDYNDFGNAVKPLIARARTALSQPEPVGMTDEEIEQFAREWNSGYDSIEFEFISDFARSFLHRYGLSSITPIPVSEGMPGPKDCNAGYFWAYAGDDWEKTHIDGMNWEYLHHHGYTHWLPWYALPVPTTSTS